MQRALVERANELYGSGSSVKSTESKTKVAFKAGQEGSKFNVVECYNCGKKGHLKKDCFTRGRRSLQKREKTRSRSYQNPKNENGDAKFTYRTFRTKDIVATNSKIKINNEELSNKWLIDR